MSHGPECKAGWQVFAVPPLGGNFRGECLTCGMVGFSAEDVEGAKKKYLRQEKHGNLVGADVEINQREERYGQADSRF